ncbi:class I SAM-dependent methyltransferase [Pseudonocardia phyllosphaerae]|uniref:class I SAM-dependent methyltransferase n=1 Tax=Pseudonocardia phyllosphaerae TaxID=3390502 RepID=UPI00397DE9AA
MSAAPAGPRRPVPAGSGIFLREFLRDPVATASCVPSSRALATAALTALPLEGDPLVVELGPGTGAFTDVLAERLGGRGRHLAVELNPRLARLLERRHPGLDVAVAPAADLPALLAERGLGPVDVVVSGLPWAAHPPTSPSLVDVVAGTLTDDGAFAQFGYVWTRRAAPARRLRRHLDAAFHDVVTSPPVLANVPPAFVYTARRPRRG